MENQLFRIILVGDSSVGKTCILFKFTDGVFKPDHNATIGVELGNRVIEINGEQIKFQIWDTSGQENFRSVTRSFYRRANCAFLVFDLVSSESFNNCSYWLGEIRGNSKKEILIYLIGNKLDLVSNTDFHITKSEIEAFTHNNNLSGYFEISAKSGDNIEFLFKAVGDKLMSLEKIPGPCDSGKFEIQVISSKSSIGKKCC